VSLLLTSSRSWPSVDIVVRSPEAASRGAAQVEFHTAAKSGFSENSRRL
jgi:hypothetical protein